MKLKEGRAIKLIKKDYHNRITERVGKIAKIYSNFILLDLKEYKTCIGIVDVLSPRDYKLKVKNNKKWIDADKEMLGVEINERFAKTAWS
ncbi:hypothetical protein I3900191A7_16090 [Clostridium baratii]|uniref:hypothetical protein n=1 Tax=Clostridium baratii TaxID=1561 RepID=UPI0036F3FEB7